ncbi:MAG: phytanoyl-CoA dioxygenase family protein [Fimbriimonadaceae bacterium]|nr:phytanoyl-CoA dioxygenase family protein [Fimbriimonadaceae bacterium]
MAAVTGVTVADLEFQAANLDVARAAAVYREHGALVVRGLMQPYVDRIRADIMQAVDAAVALLPQARQIDEGWSTPDGTLFIPAPAGFHRDRQVMVSSCRYQTSAEFFRSAFDPTALDLVEAILGPDVELFMNGQCLVKEPVGGHAKHLHQDAGYFEHKYEGPCAILSYAVPTDLVNGALYVVPGSHKLGMLRHVDTTSHLGLDPAEWSWDDALPICGEPGDSIFFHVKTIHGSPSNHSQGPRPVFIHRYRAAADYVVISATSAAKRAAAEQHVAAAKKENQLGFMVRGTRRWEDRTDG